jgi:drug/metabolite transporter (DMT)-like permease
MDIRTLLAFSAIYFVWGSTYLAIKFAVADIPPLVTAGARHLFAGLVLYLIARRHSAAPTAVEWRNSFVVGLLFFLVGHGTLHWAQQTVPSGVAALLIATEPIWIVVWLAVATHEVRLGMRSLVGVLLGLVGVALVLPHGATAGRVGIVPGIAVLVGAASWAAGIVVAGRARLPRDSTLRTASTLLAGSVLLFAGAAVTGELSELKVPSLRAAAALGYLIVFGSLAAYTAYFWLLERYPPVLVATHTYVNPLVAVLLGWALLGEVLAPATIAGAVLVVAAVALIVRRREPVAS